MASPSHGALASPSLTADDDAAERDAAERKSRRRLQNLRNQRARRLRIREQTENHSKSPFKVGRWRPRHDESLSDMVDEKPSPHSTQMSSGSSDESSVPPPGSIPVKAAGPLATLRHPRPSTAKALHLEARMWQMHILNVVWSNVFLGLMGNKHILASSARYLTASDTPEMASARYFEDYFPGIAVTLPFTAGPSSSLTPTWLQITVEHATWIDLVPFARMRDNLIMWQDYFDHVEFIRDVIGSDNIDPNQFRRPFRTDVAKRLGRTEPHRTGGDRSMLSQRGMVVWGEPYDAGNWEITPGFLEKWGWTMKECEHLLESTNHWRQMRGERPLSMTDGISDP